MAYTLNQLTMAWSAVHNGVAPDATATRALDIFASVGSADAEMLGYVLDSADDTTAVALLTYQFFTGKAPTKAGLDYLLNSAANPNDLNDAYYAKFNLENRFVNFAANLGVNGEGAAAFAAQYGAMSFDAYVASIYDTIIGKDAAKAAGVDVAAALAYLVGTRDAVLAIVTDAGMVTANSTQAQIDLAMKAAMAGLVMAASIKADIGVYAAAANNFMLAMAQGEAVYGVDLLQGYGPDSGLGSTGSGKAVDTAPAVLPGAPDPVPPVEGPPPAPRNFVLTVQDNHFTGRGLDDTFSGTETTLNAGDVLDGGGGNDKLDLVATKGSLYTVAGASITGIETVNASNDAGLSIDTRTWTGLTKLNATSVGSLSVLAATTTDVDATASTLGAANVTVFGGDAVTLDVTGATTGDITILGTKGDVSVTRATTGAADAGDITISNGADIAVTLSGAALPATGSTRSLGTVFINGSDATTTATVTGPASIADNTVFGALTAARVIVRDVNYQSTLAGTITTVEVDGFGGAGLGINGSALTTLKASHGNDIHIDNSDAVTSPVTTLDATLDDVHGVFEDEGVYETLKITQGAGQSDINLKMAALTDLDLGGTGLLKLTGLTTPDLATVTVDGAAGLEGDLSALSALTLVDATGTTGDNKVTINGGVTEFKGGSGVDDVTFSSSTVSADMDLGDGDDVVTVKFNTIPSIIVQGGLGEDTISMTSLWGQFAASSGAFIGQFDNFERLRLTNTTGESINMANLGLHHITITDGMGVTLMGMAPDDTMVLAGALSGSTALIGVGVDTADDTLNVVLEDSAGAGIDFSHGFNTSGFEHVEMAVHDGSAAPSGALEELTFTGGASTITVTGNASLELRFGGGAVQVTDVDASALTVGGLYALFSNNNAASTAVKGSATEDNTLFVDTGVATAFDYTGGAGVDTVTVRGAANTIDLGVDLVLDMVKILAPGATGATFTTVENLNIGDMLYLGASVTTLSFDAAVNVGAVALPAALDLAAASTTAGVATWFELGGNTYVVFDLSTDATFKNGVDYVVQLTGTYDLENVTISGDHFAL